MKTATVTGTIEDIEVTVNWTTTVEYSSSVPRAEWESLDEDGRENLLADLEADAAGKSVAVTDRSYSQD